MSIMRDFNMVAQIDTFGESFNVKSLKVSRMTTRGSRVGRPQLSPPEPDNAAVVE